MQDQDNKGIEMEGDFEGSLQDMQPDPDADDQEQDGDNDERLDQVRSFSLWPQLQQRFCISDNMHRVLPYTLLRYTMSLS